MCYSAEAWTLYTSYVDEFGADIDIREFWEVYLKRDEAYRVSKPDKQSGWFSVLFSENWAIVGRFRRLLAILLNGRGTIVRFAPPVSLRDTVDEGLEPERTVRKLSRVLRTHFHRIREAIIGPDLSTRRLLVDQVLAADPGYC